jgi:putative transposase
MPWQECSKMDERLRFVARLLDGEKMAVLCREFEISTRTYNQRINRDVIQPGAARSPAFNDQSQP